MLFILLSILSHSMAETNCFHEMESRNLQCETGEMRSEHDYHHFGSDWALTYEADSRVVAARRNLASMPEPRTSALEAVELGGVGGLAFVRLNKPGTDIVVAPGVHDGAFTINKKYIEYIEILMEDFFYNGVISYFAKVASDNVTVLDIGGNNGVYTNYFAQLGATHVYSVEASPSTYARLKLGVAMNSNTDRVTLIHAAIIASQTPEEVQLSVAPHSGQTGVTGKVMGVPGVQLVSVQGRSLDHIFVDSTSPLLLHRPVLLKMDIEGSEVAAWQGATKLLSQFPPMFVMCEFSTFNKALSGGKGMEILSIAKGAGYRIFVMGPSDATDSPAARAHYKNMPHRELVTDEELMRFSSQEQIFMEVAMMHRDFKGSLEDVLGPV